MKIWAASCPAKIVLFGEWGVLKGAPAVASTVRSRFRVKTSQDPNSQKIQFIDESPDSRLRPVELSSIDDTPLPPDWIRLHRDFKFLLNEFRMERSGWKLQLQRDWKISEGYGSSSALTLCLYLALKSKLETQFKISEDLDTRARFFESSPEISSLIGLDQGSGLDFATQWMGGSVHYRKSESGRHVTPLQLSFPENLVILHTGRKVDTRSAIKSSDFILPLIQKLSASVETFVDKQDWERAIEQHYELFKNTPVVPQWISELRDDLLSKNICSALKTTGAGGGDALLIYLKQNKKSEFKEWAEKHSFWLGSFPFASQGAALS